MQVAEIGQYIVAQRLIGPVRLAAAFEIGLEGLGTVSPIDPQPAMLPVHAVGVDVAHHIEHAVIGRCGPHPCRNQEGEQDSHASFGTIVATGVPPRSSGSYSPRYCFLTGFSTSLSATGRSGVSKEMVASAPNLR